VPSSFKCLKLLAELLENSVFQSCCSIRASLACDKLDLIEEHEIVPESVSNPLSIEDELNRVINERQSPMQLDMTRCCQKYKKK